jgi:hypothetical protein
LLKFGQKHRVSQPWDFLVELIWPLAAKYDAVKKFVTIHTSAEEFTAKKGGGGLWSIVASFRADRRAKDAGDNVKKQ